MDVARTARPFRIRRILLIAGLHLAAGGLAHADPMYTAIDLGTGNLTYGVDSSGNGTVTGSTGQTYLFNPAQNYLPSQWTGMSVGVPTVEPAPVGSPLTNGNPSYAYSSSTLSIMNSHGLAAGINFYGVDGHLGSSEAFLTQMQASGSWGAAIPLWAGTMTMGEPYSEIGIEGIAANGQILGHGVVDPNVNGPETLFLYDTKTQSLTNLTNLVNAMTWTNSTRLSPGQIPTWMLQNVNGHIDDQGRLLVQATEGQGGPVHNLLLIPDNLPGNQVLAPEPAAWAAFALLIGGLVAHRRFRGRAGR